MMKYIGTVGRVQVRRGQYSRRSGLLVVSIAVSSLTSKHCLLTGVCMPTLNVGISEMNRLLGTHN